MSDVRIPMQHVAQLYAAINQAIAFTAHNGPARNDDLWKELISARSTVNVYMLEPAKRLEVEFFVADKVTQ